MTYFLTTLFGSGPLRSFQSADYSLYWISSVLSIMSHMMLILFRGWVALELTNNTNIVTAAATAGELPSLILSLPGGVLADRLNRKVILIGAEIVTVVTLLVFVVLMATNQIEVWSLMVLTAIAGIAFALAIPSRMAIVPNLVSRANMANGIALSSIMFSGGMFLGNPIGGYVTDELGDAAGFLLAAVLSIVSILFLLPVNTRQDSHRGARSMMSVARDTVEGAVFVWRYKIIMGLMAIAAAAIVFGSPYQSILVVFSRDVLDSAATGAGILGSAAGAGSMMGSITIASFNTPRAIRNTILIGGIGFGLALLAFSLSPVLMLSAAVALMAGYGFQLCLVATTARAQMVISDSMRGRVAAVRTTTWGAALLGFTMIGWLAQQYGAPTATAIMAMITLAATLLIILLFPALRGTAMPERLLDMEMGDTEPELPVSVRDAT